MKKIKWSIMSLAVIFSITAAFSTKPHFDCTAWPQYWFNGTQYLPVASTYACMQGTNACTYYSTNGGITYSPCTVGTYNGCPGCAVENPQTKARPALNSEHSAESKH